MSEFYPPMNKQNSNNQLSKFISTHFQSYTTKVARQGLESGLTYYCSLTPIKRPPIAWAATSY